METYHIYDLDGTVIDSSHRYRNKPCGSIDLDYWFANMVPDKIALDKPIEPLANKLRWQIARGDNVIVCTARTMEVGDGNHAFLERERMKPPVLLHRAINDMRSDADLKEQMLDEHFVSLGHAGIDGVRCVMYEDNLTVINRLRSRGIFCLYVGP